MTRQAVALGVASGAALKTLPGGAAMLQQPERLRVVEGHIESTTTRETRFTMTAPAEQFRVVARRTLRLPAVRIGRVALHEVRAMKPVRHLASMAIGTEPLFMARRTGRRRRGRRLVIHTEHGIVDLHWPRRVEAGVG
jgi:hypothetical protein